MNTKVLVIFPKYDLSDGTHLPYWYKVFEEAGKKLDVAVLFETGQGKSRISNLSYAYLQKIFLKPFNLIERFLVLLFFVLKGYRHIYIHYSLYSFVLTWLIRPIFGLKIYLWDCELYHDKPKNNFLNWALRHTDFLVTGSPQIASAYSKVLNLESSKILVVSNYVSAYDVAPQTLDKNCKHILFVHHLSERKGSKELPHIIDLVLRELPQTQFHIVGDGPDKEWLEHITQKHQDKVIFYGRQTQSQVAALMKSCDILIMPSRNEGFPRVILEALQYELPFVSFEVGNVSELVGKLQEKFITESHNVDKFVSNIRKLLEYKNINELISENKLRAKEYNLERSSQMFIGMFSSHKPKVN